MKCSICKGNVEETFLSKIRGTYIGKKVICTNCQKTSSMEEIKKKL